MNACMERAHAPLELLLCVYCLLCAVFVLLCIPFLPWMFPENIFWRLLVQITFDDDLHSDNEHMSAHSTEQNRTEQNTTTHDTPERITSHEHATHGRARATTSPTHRKIRHGIPKQDTPHASS